MNLWGPLGAGAAIVTAGVVTAFSPDVGAALVVLLVGAVGVAYVSGRLGGENRRAVVQWALLSLVLHMVVGTIVYHSPFANPDAFTYDHIARQLVADWNGDLSSAVRWTAVTAGKEGFVYLIAVPYYVLGSTIYLAIGVNAVLCALTVPVIYDATSRLFGAKAGRLAVLLVVAWPSLLYWTAQPLREAGIVFLLACALNAAVRLWERPTMGRGVAFLLAVAVLATFRNYIAVLVGGALLAALVIAQERAGGKARTLVVLALLAVPAVVVLGGYGGFQMVVEADVETVGNIRSSNAQAGSGFAQTVSLDSPGDVVRSLPVTLPSILLGPPPWSATSAFQAFGALDGVLWWWVWVQVIRARRHSRQTDTKRWWLPALPAVAVLLILALVAGNYGYLVRARTQAFILLVPMIAAGWALVLERRAERRAARSPAGRLTSRAG